MCGRPGERGLRQVAANAITSVGTGHRHYPLCAGISQNVDKMSTQAINFRAECVMNVNQSHTSATQLEARSQWKMLMMVFGDAQGILLLEFPENGTVVR
jgi:hypothetical protein